ncbi:MAG: branched-chain amino acid ABC transporter permease [bacterium]|nr:branched-chain amino acid ABC transporter permease [Candidatus Sumerlaeota bacterium]
MRFLRNRTIAAGIAERLLGPMRRLCKACGIFSRGGGANAGDRPSLWGWIFSCRWTAVVLLALGFAASFAIPRFNLVNPYYQLILMYVCINIILAISLNLVNGYMGEFSVGHAGFMAVGAYVSAILTVKVLPAGLGQVMFPLAVAAGGAVAALVGLVVAIPSFKTRGDYLAIVTLAFNMIVKSLFENIDAVGGPRGLLGISKLTTLPWVFVWTILSVWIIRNFVYSRFGRGVLSIREDEIASDMMSVNTRHVKMLAFVVSSFFAGVAGALYAHLMQFINPRMFDILKSTDILVMVYLGGIGSIAGSILGASIYTVLLEALRPLGIWRMVFMPLVLVLVMIFRPRGIMGFREFRLFMRREDYEDRPLPAPPIASQDGGEAPT